MSSRAMKKILIAQTKEKNTEEIEEIEEIEENNEPRFNLFEVLNSEEDQIESTLEESSEVEKKSTIVTHKKNTKKVKKRKEKIIINETEQEEENIDALIQQFGIQTVLSEKKLENQEKNIFHLDAKKLNLQNEVVRVFGKKIVKIEQGNTRRGISQYKRSLLVKPKYNWPKVPGGISMEFEGIKNGKNYFRFVWSSSYKKLQEEFFMCVQTHDPNSFQYLLDTHPYHVDSLLQLSEVCKQTGDLDKALELIERSIYFLESCFHQLFNPLLGNSCLDFQIEENRTFFLALFRYIQLMGRKGFSTTSLEYCKLLLSLNFSDPLSVLFIIDSYSLRSQSYDFLLDLYVCPELKENGLSTLPNFVYSVALAKFYVEKVKGTCSEKSSADELLQHALILFPHILIPLVKRSKISLTNESVDLANHGFFASAQCPPSLQPLITLFVERNYSIWQTPEVVDWLKVNILVVIKKVELGNDQMVENCAAIIHEEYVSNSNKNYYNHLLVSEYTNDTVNALPADLLELLRREGGGPQIYDAFHQNENQPVVHATTSNPLLLFLSTLFSPVVPNAPPVNNENTDWLNNLINFLGYSEEDQQHQD